MKFADISKILDKTPFMDKSEARVVYNFILNSNIENILELGFAHGTSTCYMAAALDESKKGHILTIDNSSAFDRNPDIYNLLSISGFQNYITPIFADNSYNWELMKLIEKNSTSTGVCRPIFDFCYIDGAHTWETDGFAFFLVEKLLKPGGWILFDDLFWSLSRSPTLKNDPIIKSLPKDQKEIAQIEKVFSLLLLQHTNFDKVYQKDSWGWARKKTDVILQEDISSSDIIEKIYVERPIKDALMSLIRNIKRRL